MIGRGVGLAAAVLLAGGAGVAPAQDRGAAALGAAVQGIGVSTRVLIVGAHPDDEDTQIIAWLSRGRHVETAYLSLTRGDGGQNAIGNELGEALGAIRTEELLAARRVDGGRQYFTRAYDYGFSKNAEEAFTQWPHDSLLRDVLTVVRAFRPHVIISVFTGTPRDGHGQHQAAGILAREAYDLAADTTRFPRSATAGHGAWTVLKFYRGASFRQGDATLRMNVGEYDPLLGRSYAEVAAISRSQHRSQAFGTLERLGVRWDYLQREHSRAPAPADPKAEQGIFDGIDTTWARLRADIRTPAARAALDSLPPAFVAVRAAFDAMAPEAVVAPLARVRGLLDRLCGSSAEETSVCFGSPPPRNGAHRPIPGRSEAGTMVAVAMARVDRALALATGVVLEATATREIWSTGETVALSITVYNRGRVPVELVAWDAALLRRGVAGDGVAGDRARITATGLNRPLAPDSAVTVITSERPGPLVAAITQPWWLEEPRRGAVFTADVVGLPEHVNAANSEATVAVRASGATFVVTGPIVYRYADPVRGEINTPIAGAPAVSVVLDRELEYAPANAPIQRPVRVHVRSAATAPRDVDVTVRLPNGLTADSTTRRVTLPGPGSVRTVVFNVRGRLAPGRHAIEAVATSGGETFAQGYVAIDYEHIRTQRLYRPSRLSLEAVDVQRPAAMHVAYIPGVGDNSAPMLEQLGIPVTMLDPAALPSTDLSKFSAVVVGPRAYEASAALVANNARLLEYVREGGTMVVQYGQYEMTQPGIMPYPITINRPHDRVTVEGAPVRITDPAAPVLQAPNRITEADFAGWVQDRSLYMPRTFDERYRAMLEMNDPGEPPRNGALLVAAYGQGTYVYTTLAFFRQLPNGVPGAARLFVNLLAAKAPRTAQ